MKKLFTEHPKSVNETYGQHLRFAGCTGLQITVAGLACVVHAIFPFLFEQTASRCLEKLHQKMKSRTDND